MNAFRGTKSGLIAIVLGVLGLATVACSERPKTTEEQDREIRQKSAEVTATIKQGAKETAAEAKVAAADAGHKLGAVAAGVKEGLQSGNARVDLNTATVERLATLPGIGNSKARQIVKGRPYGSSHDLVAKGILSESQYERISPQITAR
jgi:competence protein ComEA